MKRNNQAGFAFIEAVLVFVVIIGIAAVGLVMLRRNSSPTASTSKPTVSNTAATVLAAPTVQKTSDLTKAQQTLDQTNVDAGATDATQLDSQLNGF